MWENGEFSVCHDVEGQVITNLKILLADFI